MYMIIVLLHLFILMGFWDFWLSEDEFTTQTQPRPRSLRWHTTDTSFHKGSSWHGGQWLDIASICHLHNLTAMKAVAFEDDLISF